MNLKQKIKDKLGTNEEESFEPPYEVSHLSPDDNCWGNRISFRDYPERVDGHKSPRPNEGDLFAHRLESGKIGVFKFTDVDKCVDPNDMFFADVEAVDRVESEEKLEQENKGSMFV